MLKINNIRIKNFGPYYGEYNIAFPDAEGISIVWGLNGVGKTSIMRSFSYVLWGKIMGSRRELPNHSFVNRLALKDDGKMFVELDMSYDGHKYLLTRGMNKERGDGTSASDYENYCKMTCDGNVMLPDEVENFLDTALPNNIARFYLFDGELLSEYARLLDEQDQAGHIIKKAIEDILGLPILEHAKNNLDGIYQDFSKAAAAAAKKQTTTAIQAKDLESSLEDRKHKQESLKDLQAKLAEELINRTQFENILAENERFSMLVAKRKQLEESLQRLHVKLKEKKDAAASLVNDAWRNILNHLITDCIQRTESEISDIRLRNDVIEEKKAIVRHIENLLSKKPNECPICEHTMTNLEREAILQKIGHYASGGNLSREECATLSKGEATINALQKLLLPDSTEEIDTIIREIEEIEDDINLTDSEYKSTLDTIKSMGCNGMEESIMSIPSKLAICIKNIEEYNEAIRVQEEAIKTVDKHIDKLNKIVLSKSNNPDVALANAKSRLSNDLMSLLEEGIAIFRDKLKASVQEDATNVFKRISHNSEYDRLSINDSFGLGILLADGTLSPTWSSGYEQVVAISLILALHKNTPIGGPIFMDSTFQRIDPLHKINLMKCLSQLGNQIVILAYDGEMQPQKSDVRTIFGESLKQEYKLTQLSTLQTTIEKEEVWTI